MIDTDNTRGPNRAAGNDEAYLIPWASDLLDRLGELPAKLDVDRWTGALGDRPGANYLALIAAATAAFYRAEKGHNPKVNDIWDAMVYTTTCCSVGFSDIFARTPVGKAVGSLLMTIGPSLAAAAVDGSRSQRREREGQAARPTDV